MQIICPKCNQKYRVKAEDYGKKCKCKKCDEIFIIEASEDFLNELDDIIEKGEESNRKKRKKQTFSISLDKLDNFFSLKYKFLILIVIFIFLLIGLISMNKNNSNNRTTSSNKINVNAKSESNYKAAEQENTETGKDEDATKEVAKKTSKHKRLKRSIFGRIRKKDIKPEKTKEEKGLAEKTYSLSRYAFVSSCKELKAKLSKYREKDIYIILSFEKISSEGLAVFRDKYSYGLVVKYPSRLTDKILSLEEGSYRNTIVYNLYGKVITYEGQPFLKLDYIN